MKKAISAGGILTKIDGDNIKICLIELNDSKSYVFPKGHVNESETYEDAALREVREETGLQNTRTVKKLGVVTRKSVEDDGTEVLKDIHLYLLSTADYKHVNPEEKYAWFNISEVKEKFAFEEESTFLAQHLKDIVSSTVK